MQAIAQHDLFIYQYIHVGPILPPLDLDDATSIDPSILHDAIVSL